MKKKDRKEKSAAEAPDAREEMKRLNRVIGQIEGIRRMLEEDRPLEDILMQSKAVHSALKAVESRILKRYLDAAIAEIGKGEKKKSREQKITGLMELYRHVA